MCPMHGEAKQIEMLEFGREKGQARRWVTRAPKTRTFSKGQQSIVKGQVKWVGICFTIVHMLSVSPSALFIAKSIHEQGWCYVSLVFPVVMYGCESWTIKKAEC